MPTILIDSSDHKTELCIIGEQLATDKSPYCPEGHRHPYTAIYNLLFAPLKNKNIILVEIGVWRSASIKLWSLFFKNSKIYGFDYDRSMIERCNNYYIKNANALYMNVKDSQSINEGLLMINELVDIIIDDSSHEVDDQIRIINETFKYLKSGGYLIVEDIYEACDEELYINKLDNIITHCSFYTFITAAHTNTFTDGINNNKMLILIKE